MWFPHVSEASVDGILAIGGDLSAERLMLAYQSGIFPWYEDDQPIIWWSPDPRMVLFPENFKISKSFRKILRNTTFTVTFNEDFPAVIKNCATVKRNGQRGTWITKEMQDAYISMHKKTIAVSVEVWDGEELVGGLYGIDLKEQKVFCGESMFSKKSEASKIAFYHLSQKLKNERYKIIDCQIHNSHLESLGAEEIPRSEFMRYLNK